MQRIFWGLILSFIAALATSVGGALVFFIKKRDKKMLALALGFSAGVMIAVSFFELMKTSIAGLGLLIASICFFVGMVFIFLLDVYIPHSFMAEKIPKCDKCLLKVGFITAAGIAIHNFPEGFAVFASTMSSLKLGVLITVAIAIHNIPEGVCVAMPIYYATNNRKKAFWYSFLSGILEPVGAIIAALILLPFLSQAIIDYSLAFVAGVMVYISIDELLPAAHRYGKEHTITFGFILGMAVMVATLVILV